MPASFLQHHRTICAVLDEIRALALQRGDDTTVRLCDEALTYARRMSEKLVEYKALQQ